MNADSPCHDQSQISAPLDGSAIVDPYFRPQWLPNFSNIRAHCGIRSGLQKPGMKSCGVCALGCSAFRGSDRFTVTKSVQKGRGTCLSRRDLPVISALVAIRQTHERNAAEKLGELFGTGWPEIDKGNWFLSQVFPKKKKGWPVGSNQQAQTGGREGTRTPDFLVANEEKSKLRCGTTIT